MIYYLNGTLVEKNPALAVIECAGVGYRVKISINTYDRLPMVKQNVKLMTYFSVGEGFQTLYGFHDSDEKKVFELLIGISGIGPALALNILSGSNPAALQDMIVQEDEGRVKQIKGVGPKTAKRIIVELKPAFETLQFGDRSKIDPAQQNVQDAQLALISLGYNRTSAMNAVNKVVEKSDENDHQVDFLVKEALKYI